MSVEDLTGAGGSNSGRFGGSWARTAAKKPVVKPTPPKGSPVARSTKPRPPGAKEDTDSMSAPPPSPKKPNLRRPMKEEEGADDFWNGLK